MARDRSPLFEFSRNPLEALLLDFHKSNTRWFEVNGARSVRSLLKTLQSTPGVGHADLASATSRQEDEFGATFVHECQLTIRFKGEDEIRAGGMSASPTAELAETIALAECMERLAYKISYRTATADQRHRTFRTKPLIHDHTTNGAAFHSSPLKALKSSLCELLERDAFLTNWYSHRDLPVSPIEKGDRLHEAWRKLDRLGWSLREHCWKHDKVDAVCVWLSLIRKDLAPNQWNFLLGGGAGASYDEAVDRAWAESLRQFRDLRTITYGVDTSGRAVPSVLKTIESRHIVYQKPYFARRFLDRLGAPRAPRPLHGKGLEDREFVIQAFRNLRSARVVPLALPTALVPHVYCIKVVCDELQNLAFDVPAKVNLPRVFARYGTRPHQVTRLIHPVA